MKNHSMVIWRDVPVLVKRKEIHIHKIGKKVHNDFCISYGEIPVGVFNDITKQWEPVDNQRGLGYATRTRLKFRKNKKKFNGR